VWVCWNHDAATMKLVSDLFFIAVVLVSAAWWISVPSHESALAFLTSTAALVARVATAFRSRETSLLIGQFLLPLVRWKDQRTPEAKLEFDSISGTRAIHHRLHAWRVWDSEGPMLWMELRQKQDNGSWSTVYRFEGHSVELLAQDIDGDNHPEVVIRYACGAHTRVLNIFRVAPDGFLTPIPGALIGSDWPDIVLQDRDNDGKVEIYAKQRDWARIPTRDSVTEVYIYGEYGLYKKEEAPKDAAQATREDARA
jgi:hypothetical protein